MARCDSCVLNQVRRITAFTQPVACSLAPVACRRVRHRTQGAVRNHPARPTREHSAQSRGQTSNALGGGNQRSPHPPPLRLQSTLRYPRVPLLHEVLYVYSHDLLRPFSYPTHWLQKPGPTAPFAVRRSRVAAMTPKPYLTEDELAEICAPLVTPAAQRRYLERLGLVVKVKPNGRPLVARGEFERVLVGRQSEPAIAASASHPNRAALLQLFRGTKSGTQAQGR